MVPYNLDEGDIQPFTENLACYPHTLSVSTDKGVSELADDKPGARESLRNILPLPFPVNERIQFYTVTILNSCCLRMAAALGGLCTRACTAEPSTQTSVIVCLLLGVART